MAILAFDIGGSSIKYAVAEENGELSAQGKRPVPPTIGEFYDTLADVRRELSHGREFTGAAFSFPGAVDTETGLIGGSSALPYIHGFPIQQAIEERLSLPCALENDANCAALGEAWLGVGKDYRDMAFFVIGTGVGGAVVIDKKIHHGKHVHGGEFGYMLLGKDHTILSDLGSTRIVVQRVTEALRLAPGSLDGKQVFDLAEHGNKYAVQAVTEFYEVLARGIYNLQYAIDPEIFVLGGAVSERPGFAAAIQRHVDKILKDVGVAHVRPIVRAAAFGNEANLLGAVKNFLDSRKA